MPAARGVKRTASKSSATAPASAPKNKKKRGVVQLEIPVAPKKRGRVLACGQGDMGQLGLGEDVMETTKFKYISTLGEKIVDVVAGGMHTVALDSNGKIWTFGCNDEGALGRNTTGSNDEDTPKSVSLPHKAVSIAAGDSHSAAILDNGDVYAWGAFRDSHGSMGLVVRGREGKACKDPVKVDIGEPAAGIASGGDHLVILSTSGSVYTMGCGEQGQLGRLSQRSASRDARQGFSALLSPMKVTLKGGAARVWAGYHATFALRATGDRLLAWGLNNYGQLGVSGEKRKTALFSPSECDAFGDGPFVSVTCGQHHTLALDSAGQVYAIGRHEYGRLGLGERTADAESLEPVTKLQSKKCISIAAGTCNSFAVTDSGEVFAWGMGSEGQLGTGASADEAEPRAAPMPVAPAAARLVSAGGQHTVLLLDDSATQKEDSPEPEEETADQKMDDVSEEPTQEPEKKKARGTKGRPKKQEQEDEVSSTSSAAPARPQKVNGDEKKEDPMEVDETDNPQEQKEETTKTKADTKEETKEQDDEEEETEKEPETEPETETETKAVSKPETTDTSSQETTDSDTKSQETDKSDKSNDIEMEESGKEINGEVETPAVAVEAKTVEALLPTPSPLTTTA